MRLLVVSGRETFLGWIGDGGCKGAADRMQGLQGVDVAGLEGMTLGTLARKHLQRIAAGERTNLLIHIMDKPICGGRLYPVAQLSEAPLLGLEAGRDADFRLAPSRPHPLAIARPRASRVGGLISFKPRITTYLNVHSVC